MDLRGPHREAILAKFLCKAVLHVLLEAFRFKHPLSQEKIKGPLRLA